MQLNLPEKTYLKCLKKTQVDRSITNPTSVKSILETLPEFKNSLIFETGIHDSERKLVFEEETMKNLLNFAKTTFGGESFQTFTQLFHHIF